MSVGRLRFLSGVILITSALLISGCDSRPADAPQTQTPPEAMQTELKTGGIYASMTENGKFSLSKILALDESAVHVRFYYEEFDEVPESISSRNLTFLIGHAPLAREGLLERGQHLITTEDVSDEEFEGYKLYLEAMSE